MKTRFCTILWLTAALSGLQLATGFAAPITSTGPTAKDAATASALKGPAKSAAPAARCGAQASPSVPVCCSANCEGCGQGYVGGCSQYECTSCACGCGMGETGPVVKCCSIRGGSESCTTVYCTEQ